eukprot:scaffold4343_cov144-Cylindrotheca_fusiformis.AAC.26
MSCDLVDSPTSYKLFSASTIEMAEKKGKSSFVSTSCVSSVLMILYVAMACMNLYGLMYPLSRVDLSTTPPDDFVNPLWEKEASIHMKVYLSAKNKFDKSFVDSEFREETDGDTVLLWKEDIHAGTLSKSFLITSIDCREENCEAEDDPSTKQAIAWLDQADRQVLAAEAGILSALSAAGQGVESTSILLTLFNAAKSKIDSLLSEFSMKKDPDNQDRRSSSDFLSRSKVGLVKYDVPNHITKPGRILYHDITYILKKYILGDNTAVSPPWDMQHAQPKYFEVYQNAQRMKEENEGYPYFKPEVAVKYLVDEDSYPMNYARVSGMELVRVIRSKEHPSSIAHIPVLHVDEIGLTSEKYIPLNSTISSLPLRISFSRSDVEDDSQIHQATATSGSISAARWRLLSHLSQAIESQKELGFDQSDIDDLRRLIADTNITLLGITMLASALHLLFEFLTFKNEVSFWRNNKDLTGLSVRSLFLDMIGQFIIVLFLIEKESSLLMIVPSACGVLIALWKCQRAAGLAVVKVDNSHPAAWWNLLPRVLGLEIRATRLDIDRVGSYDRSGDDSVGKDNPQHSLHALTIECDRIATEKLSTVLLPLVAGYTLYSFITEEHSTWYSWLITSASSAVYALGFVLMTPQLFLNYKMKSVAHLPWRVMVYKSLNTFIDDLFSFIIRMPTMARISCFRDDVVFFIYLYQRWLYPVDEARPTEGGGDVPSEEGGLGETKKDR